MNTSYVYISFRVKNTEDFPMEWSCGGTNLQKMDFDIPGALHRGIGAAWVTILYFSHY